MDQTDYRQRDAASFLMLGTFFAVMGSLVLVGTFWTLERMHAMVRSSTSTAGRCATWAVTAAAPGRAASSGT